MVVKIEIKKKNRTNRRAVVPGSTREIITITKPEASWKLNTFLCKYLREYGSHYSSFHWSFAHFSSLGEMGEGAVKAQNIHKSTLISNGIFHAQSYRRS